MLVKQRSWNPRSRSRPGGPDRWSRRPGRGQCHHRLSQCRRRNRHPTTAGAAGTPAAAAASAAAATEPEPEPEPHPEPLPEALQAALDVFGVSVTSGWRLAWHLPAVWGPRVASDRRFW
jgi:hypothetical protein